LKRTFFPHYVFLNPYQKPSSYWHMGFFLTRNSIPLIYLYIYIYIFLCQYQHCCLARISFWPNLVIPILQGWGGRTTN
jgi:hypothetical protein